MRRLVERLVFRLRRRMRALTHGRALDPVAHFHLTNGARVERLNWRGDLSEKGVQQSFGMMINYLYRLPDIEANHEAYRSEGRIAASGTFNRLAKSRTVTPS